MNPVAVTRLGWSALALGTVIVLISAAQTWFTAPVSAIAISGVSATGFQAVPALMSVLLVIAAAVVARRLTRSGLARVLLGVVASVAALAVPVMLAIAASDGESPLARNAAAATGVAEVSGPASSTGWGWVAVAGAVLLAFGVLTTMVGRPGRSTGRFERPAPRPAGRRGLAPGARSTTGTR